jgi:hypothetical protein
MLREVKNSIINIVDLLVNDQIVIDANAIIERRHGDRTFVSCERDAMAVRPAKLPFASMREYREFLSGGRYSVVLHDGGFIYLSYQFLNDEVVGHSIVYYPVPFDLDREELASFSLEECLDSVCNVAESVRLRSPIRFDYDRVNARSDHACVHAHLNTGDCRIPVSRPIGPIDFVVFVLRSFYPKEWGRSRLAKLKSSPLGSVYVANGVSHLHFRLH